MAQEPSGGWDAYVPPEQKPATLIDTGQSAVPDKVLDGLGFAWAWLWVLLYGALAAGTTALGLLALFAVVMGRLNILQGLFMMAGIGIVAYFMWCEAVGALPERERGPDTQVLPEHTLSIRHDAILMRRTDEAAKGALRPESGIVFLDADRLRVDGSSNELDVRGMDVDAIAAALDDHGWQVERAWGSAGDPGSSTGLAGR